MARCCEFNAAQPRIGLPARPLARIIHEGSSRKRADVKRDGHSEP